jgi:hypothetical protein
MKVVRAVLGIVAHEGGCRQCPERHMVCAGFEILAQTRADVKSAGETLWMYDMIDRFGEKAKATGAKIVHTCGFDSEPSVSEERSVRLRLGSSSALAFIPGVN